MTNSATHQAYALTCDSRDAIVFIHGILGSPGQFRFLAEEFHRRGYDCHGLLLPGHGGTGWDFARTPCRQWDQAVAQALNGLRGQYQRVFLVGHSLGGLLSLEYAASHDVAGVVLLNAPLGFRISLKQLSFAAKIMLGRAGESDEFMTVYRQAYGVSDVKLYEYPLWLRQFFGLFRHMRQARRMLGEVKAPVLIVQSALDESVYRKSAGWLKAGLSRSSCSMVRLGESYHGYFPEGDRETLIQAIEIFIQTDVWSGASAK